MTFTEAGHRGGNQDVLALLFGRFHVVVVKTTTAYRPPTGPTSRSEVSRRHESSQLQRDSDSAVSGWSCRFTHTAGEGDARSRGRGWPVHCLWRCQPAGRWGHTGHLSAPSRTGRESLDPLRRKSISYFQTSSWLFWLRTMHSQVTHFWIATTRNNSSLWLKTQKSFADSYWVQSERGINFPTIYETTWPFRCGGETLKCVKRMKSHPGQG